MERWAGSSAAELAELARLLEHRAAPVPLMQKRRRMQEHSERALANPILLHEKTIAPAASDAET
jgi:hypothetical protein